MDELLELGLKEYKEAMLSIAFDCPLCHNNFKKIVGWSNSYGPRAYAVFECLNCSTLFKHHIHSVQGDFIKAVKKRLIIEEGFSARLTKYLRLS